MSQIITVTQLNNYLKNLIDQDYAIKNITVKGEISNFTNHVKTGHFYFTLKDKACSIRVIMFRSYAQRVRFDVQNGMNVLVTGGVRLFERDGNVQLYCEELQPDGIGALYLAFEQLKEKLEKQGLFAAEHKKPIPAFPRKIGVVTSKTGAALQDIINILSRRFPLGTVVLIPALVQGENAPQSICEGIALAEAYAGLDVLIVGRGGGSMEDLWAFNDERVARAVYSCTIPVISAVGHEVDFTITDFVADLRAPTPSAAAELCAPDIRELENHLSGLQSLLDSGLSLALRQNLDRLKSTYNRLKACSPEQKIVQNHADLDKLSGRLGVALENTLTKKEKEYLRHVSMLEALSPLKVLTRGYSITYSEAGQVVTELQQAAPGSRLKTRVQEGLVYSEVISTEPIKS